MVHTIRACRGVTARLVIAALIVTGCSTNRQHPVRAGTDGHHPVLIEREPA
jgi:hypothetical protein